MLYDSNAHLKVIVVSDQEANEGCGGSNQYSLQRR
jgi:hypothetical protein